MKKLLTPALALVVLAAFTCLSVVQGAPQKSPQKGRFASLEIMEPATVLVCKRPAIPAHDEGKERCHGNWLPTDNTDKFTYQAAQGPDHFNKTSWPKADRRCEKCPNGTHLVVDFKGLEDWCVNSVPAQSAAIATPSCPQGFTWNGNICSRPAIPAHDEGKERCHGNWLPTDNTDKFTYQAAQGPDHFNKTSWPKADRRCEKCPNGTHLVVDFKGLEDWCVNSVPAQSAATVAGTCAPGFTLGPQ